ncbi:MULTISPECIES: Vms1/Ankzf1 family peptidyl-tRNA hydrolase [unclassified Solwaraspora]|uniref:baeRF2 domain-containing protein n=1 Tax=unclassified Solwaraspora TaxID=2627926 RepID=UPI00259B70BE|nr:Vms1/Ankzf1 family peptidyl-tRNA hydrolase [Solwaraspora sp. WMMA2056]WJK39052.1 Vms1/Ankzf1 family peptidyl-tRNA hydrolase [Solwaraspora sp. WMMA2056]
MDLSFLQPLYSRPGPWASVYLDASRDTEDAVEALELRWRALRQQLEQQGADQLSVAALGHAVLRHVPRAGEYGLALSATDGEVVLQNYLPAPPRHDLAVVGPLPHAMPLVAQRGEEISWLRVLVSRTGADIDAVSAGGLPRQANVTGPASHPIRKVNPGAWSQARFQRAAEVSWQRNAGHSAAATAALADQVGAEVLVVAGDPQARELLISELPRRWQSRTVQTDVGSRAVGADPEPLTEVTIQAIAEVAAAHTGQALDRYGAQRGRGDGIGAVVDALQRAQVDTLLLVDDPSSTQRLWIGPEPTHIALDPDELTAMSVAAPREVRADAALLRALAGTDADLVLVGPGEADLDGGVGAVLRYLDPATG